MKEICIAPPNETISLPCSSYFEEDGIKLKLNPSKGKLCKLDISNVGSSDFGNLSKVDYIVISKSEDKILLVELTRIINSFVSKIFKIEKDIRSSFGGSLPGDINEVVNLVKDNKFLRKAIFAEYKDKLFQTLALLGEGFCKKYHYLIVNTVEYIPREPLINPYAYLYVFLLFEDTLKETLENTLSGRFINVSIRNILPNSTLDLSNFI